MQVNFCWPPGSLEPYIWGFGGDGEDLELRGNKCHLEPVATLCPGPQFPSSFKSLCPDRAGPTYHLLGAAHSHPATAWPHRCGSGSSSDERNGLQHRGVPGYRGVPHRVHTAPRHQPAPAPRPQGQLESRPAAKIFLSLETLLLALPGLCRQCALSHLLVLGWGCRGYARIWGRWLLNTGAVSFYLRR